MEDLNKKTVRPTKAISDVAPYENSKYSGAVFEENKGILKLDSNETYAPPSPNVIKALSAFIQNEPLNWYPDVESKRLRERISSYTNFPIDSIQTFNGSDNALECIARTYVEKGDEVIICAPTYDHFRVYAQSCGGRVIPVYGETPFVAKPKRLIEATTPKTKIIYIANPNNPTGVLYTNEQVEYVLKNAPDKLVIVDEAYYEFCKVTMAAFVDCFSNIIITRSFSKTFGLAGLRCGYIICHPEHIKNINKVRIGKNINSLAQIAAIAALEDLSYSQQYVEEAHQAKRWLIEKLTSIGLKTVNTPANFILVQAKEPKAVVSFLEARGIYIRDRSNQSQLGGFLRITTAPISVMERLWQTFKDIPQKLLSVG